MERPPTVRTVTIPFADLKVRLPRLDKCAVLLYRGSGVRVSESSWF
jgi:hypothetical protein